MTQITLYKLLLTVHNAAKYHHIKITLKYFFMLVIISIAGSPLFKHGLADKKAAWTGWKKKRKEYFYILSNILHFYCWKKSDFLKEHPPPPTKNFQVSHQWLHILLHALYKFLLLYKADKILDTFMHFQNLTTC